MPPFPLSIVHRAPLWISAGMSAWAVALWVLYRRSARPIQRNVFFGMTVPVDWPDSPAGRAVSAAYQRRVGVASAVALALALVDGWPAVFAHTQGALALGGLVLQAIAATAAYVAGRRAALPMAVPAATVREASLEPGRSPSTGRWLAAQAGPVVVLAASALLLALRYPAIPARLPMRGDGLGHVTRWGVKSVGAVFWLPMIGLLTVGLLGGTGWVIVHSGRRVRDAGRDDQYLRGVLWLLLVGEYFGVLVLSAVSWIPGATGTHWSWVPWGVAIGSTPVLAVAIGYFAVRIWPAVRPAVAGGDGTPDRCWRWGLFYANADDPAVLVPKRFGFGYTFNFARGGTWAMVAGTVLYVAAAVALPLLTRRH